MGTSTGMSGTSREGGRPDGTLRVFPRSTDDHCRSANINAGTVAIQRIAHSIQQLLPQPMAA